MGRCKKNIERLKNTIVGTVFMVFALFNIISTTQAQTTCVKECGVAIWPLIKNMSTLPNTISTLTRQLKNKQGGLNINAIGSICLPSDIINPLINGFTLANSCNSSPPCCNKDTIDAANTPFGNYSLDVQIVCNITSSLNPYSAELIQDINCLNCQAAGIEVAGC